MAVAVAQWLWLNGSGSMAVVGCVMDGLLAPSLRFLALGQWVAVAQLHWLWLSGSGSGWVAVVEWQWLWLNGCG
jgi:hypothetical protein